MPACSRERVRRAAAVTALALVLPGCVTGHLAAAARRREYAREIHAVTRDDRGTLVRYTAEVTDDAGASLGMVERTARLPPGTHEPALRALTRLRTAAWVYPLVPLALAADVVVVPTLVLMSPAVLVVGD
jgi:hypothetical protein